MTIETMFVNAQDKPMFELSLECPKHRTDLIGWGEPTRPSVRIVTVLDSGERHGLAIYFDTNEEAKRFLRVGVMEVSPL